MAVLFANNAFGTLAVSVDTLITSITVSTGEGARFPNPTGADFFYVTLVNQANELEIVKCTARSNDTMTIQRAQEGTPARSFAAGDRVELRLTAAGISSFGVGSIPLGGIIAIRTGLTGAYTVPTSGTVSAEGFIYCDGSTIPAGNTVQGAAPNLTDGRFLRGATSAGSTGGSDSFTLSTANLPAHSHTGTTSSAGSHSHSGTANSAGAHTHTYVRNSSSFTAAGQSCDHYGNCSPGISGALRSTTSAATSSSGAHTHSLSINSNGAHTHTFTTANTGSGTAKEHIPKYFNVVYLMRVN